MRKLTTIVALTAALAFASPALADFYVVNDGGSCRIVETAMNAKPDGGNYGNKHLSKEDAEKAMAEDANCKKYVLLRDALRSASVQEARYRDAPPMTGWAGPDIRPVRPTALSRLQRSGVSRSLFRMR
jgi:hypothetical protein